MTVTVTCHDGGAARRPHVQQPEWLWTRSQVMQGPMKPVHHFRIRLLPF